MAANLCETTKIDRKTAEAIVAGLEVVTQAIGALFPLLEGLGEPLSRDVAKIVLGASGDIYSGVISPISSVFPDLDPYKPKDLLTLDKCAL